MVISNKIQEYLVINERSRKWLVNRLREMDILISKTMIDKYCRNEVQPPQYVAVGITKIFDISLDELIIENN
jgi:ribosome-binding protein aMBF1 (putative translation factor)